MMTMMMSMVDDSEVDSYGKSNGKEDEDCMMENYKLFYIFAPATGQATKEMIEFRCPMFILFFLMFGLSPQAKRADANYFNIEVILSV